MTNQMERRKVDQLKPNPNNPRTIKTAKFRKLVNSVRNFSGMLEVRPLVITPEGVVLGGNMRLEACKEAGLKEVPVIVVDWSEDRQREFIIKDNLGYGEWDYDILANEWNVETLLDWGLDLWEHPEETEPKEKEVNEPCKCCGK